MCDSIMPVFAGGNRTVLEQINTCEQVSSIQTPLEFLPKGCLTDSISSCARKFFDTLNVIIGPIQKIIVVKNLVQIVNLPAIIKNIIKKCAIFNEISRQKKIDAGLSLCNNLREIGETTGTFVVALEQLKIIPEITAKWALPFSATITALSIFSIASQFRTCAKVVRLMQRFESIAEKSKVDGKISLRSYQGILYHIEKKQAKDEDFIGEIFNTNEEKLAEALVGTEISIKEKLSSADQDEVQAGQEKLENAVEGLRGRIKKNLISTALCITAATVNIIGTVLLLTMPAVPLGWVFLGLGVAVDIGRFMQRKVSEYQFTQAVGLKRNNWEWITC